MSIVIAEKAGERENTTNMDDAQMKQAIKERYDALPHAVQKAITSTDVEKHLRSVAKKYQLHYDKWVSLENEVMMALLGVQPVEKLGENIAKEAGVSGEMGEQIADDAFDLIFEPIREELERELKHPAVKPKEETQDERLQRIMTEDAHADAEEKPAAAETNAPPAPAPASGTPTGAPHSVSTAPSTERKEIEGDPYREPVN